VTARAVSQTEAGLAGTETMRLLNLGVFDVVHGPIAYVSGDAQAIDGIELPMLATDIDQFRKIIDAYMPILEREFSEKFNAKLLSIYTLPRLQMYCNLGADAGENITLEDLKGKKIRTFSAALGDFVEAIGGTPVSIPLAEVVPALQRGVADCGVTASLSAYNAKWYEVTTHAIQVNLGYSAGFMAVNMDVWKSLSDEDQASITAAIPDLWNESWAIEAANEARGENCITDGPCDGETGNLIAVDFPDEDERALRDIFESTIVNRWAERCGTASCVGEWNETVGAIVGVQAQAAN
jgi:TRAP-type C4-dicarboxylate transport system substrate-binding protein